MKKGDLFPLADLYLEDKRFNFFYSGNDKKSLANLRAEYTGEKRLPKRGEWFLSGNPIEAYRAFNDMTSPYHIARIVLIEKITIERIIEVLGE